MCISTIRYEPHDYLSDSDVCTSPCTPEPKAMEFFTCLAISVGLGCLVGIPITIIGAAQKNPYLWGTGVFLFSSPFLLTFIKISCISRWYLRNEEASGERQSLNSYRQI